MPRYRVSGDAALLVTTSRIVPVVIEVEIPALHASADFARSVAEGHIRDRFRKQLDNTPTDYPDDEHYCDVTWLDREAVTVELVETPDAQTPAEND